ncbi:hypothetical protein ACN47E_008846 [Coniothyrium glycines]
MNYLPSALRPRGRDRVRNVEDGLSGTSLQFPPGPQPPQLTRQGTIDFDPENKLSLFRHLIGIHSTRELSQPRIDEKGNTIHAHSHNALHFDGRAAPNLGIYNRVCHREAAAKRGYRFASILINSCLGLQVVVAASLTAMGAANGNRVGITAFGAINTVIAGLLTYLKGSGLPNRIRWYENEWKKVREYIEQRERDFSRPGCQLDVVQVVEAVEAMYEEVKADIQTNTPESYISVSDIRARSAAATNPQIPKLKDMVGSSTSQGKSKLEELELKYGHKVTGLLESLAHKEEERLKRIEGDIDAGKATALAALADEKNKATTAARDWERDLQAKGARTAEKELEHARSSVLARGMSFAQDLDNARTGAAQRGESFSRGLEGARAAVRQKGDALQQGVSAATSAAVQRGDALQSNLYDAGAAVQHAHAGLAQNVESAKADALQRGRDYGSDMQNRASVAEQELARDLEAREARIAEAERELAIQAQRTRETAVGVGESVQAAGEGAQRTGESLQRIGKVVEEEIQPHQKS